MSNNLGLIGYDFVEFYVGSAKMWAYWHAKAMGLQCKAYLGPETGHRDRVSYYLENNNIRLVLTSAVKPSTYDVASFVEKHGDGVKRWSVRVKNVKESFETSLRNGGIPVRYPKKSEDENGFIEEAAIIRYNSLY